MTYAETVEHLHAAMRHDFRVLAIVLGVVIGLLAVLVVRR